MFKLEADMYYAETRSDSVQIDNNVDLALMLLDQVIPAGDNETYYYGQEYGDIECKEIPQFPGITSLHKLYAVLRQAWSAETAYPSCQKDWVEDDPSYGQCAITSTLVYDMFGGTIHRIKVDGGGTHYFNKINGHYVDLTREQFDLYDLPVSYEPNEEMPRQYCGKNPDTLKRYQQLQRNIIKFLKEELR